MIIGVCGLGYTGSSAVVDFLKEFDENYVIDAMEFALAYIPDGLEDLEYHLIKSPSRYFSSDIAIRRFKNYIESRCTPRSKYKAVTNNKFKSLSYDYIESLIQVKWQGTWSFDSVGTTWWKKNFKYRLLGRIQMLSDKVLKKFVPILPEREMCLSIRPKNFYELTRKYIKEILMSACCDDKKNIVLNQPFSGDNPEKSFVFFDNPLAIIVDRDPRDLYICAKKVVLSYGRFTPSNTVETFVKYYKALRINQNPINDISRVLKINFEDLIYEYDNTAKKIIEFTGLKDHTSKKRFFNPDVSKYNTQLFRKYNEFNDEIKYIEQELTEWLFPFGKYVPLTNHGKSF